MINAHRASDSNSHFTHFGRRRKSNKNAILVHALKKIRHPTIRFRDQPKQERGCTHYRAWPWSSMTIYPRIPTMPGRSTSGRGVPCAIPLHVRKNPTPHSPFTRPRQKERVGGYQNHGRQTINKTKTGFVNSSRNPTSLVCSSL